MAYSTFTSILTILPGLPQTDTSNGYTETTVIIAKHITRADSMIDAKISKRYSIPVSDAPILTAISEDITSYYTYRSFYTQDNLNRNEYFEELKVEALACLDDIRNGDIDLVDSSGNVINENSEENNQAIDSTTINEQTFFDTDSPFNWKFDSDRQDNIKDRR